MDGPAATPCFTAVGKREPTYGDKGKAWGGGESSRAVAGRAAGQWRGERQASPCACTLWARVPGGWVPGSCRGGCQDLATLGLAGMLPLCPCGWAPLGTALRGTGLGWYF